MIPPINNVVAVVVGPGDQPPQEVPLPQGQEVDDAAMQDILRRALVQRQRHIARQRLAQNNNPNQGGVAVQQHINPPNDPDNNDNQVHEQDPNH